MKSVFQLFVFLLINSSCESFKFEQPPKGRNGEISMETSKMVDELVDEIMEQLSKKQAHELSNKISTLDSNEIMNEIIEPVQNEIDESVLENETNNQILQDIVREVFEAILDVTEAVKESDLKKLDEDELKPLENTLKSIISQIIIANSVSSETNSKKSTTASMSLVGGNTPIKFSSLPDKNAVELEIIENITALVTIQLNQVLESEGDMKVPDLTDDAITKLGREIINELSSIIDLSLMSEENIETLVEEVSVMILDELVHKPFPGMARISLRENISSFISRVTDIATDIVTQIAGSSDIPTSSPTFAIELTSSPTASPTLSPTISTTSSPSKSPILVTMKPTSVEMALVSIVVIEVDRLLEDEEVGVTLKQFDRDDISSFVAEILEREDMDFDLSSLSNEEKEDLAIEIAQIIIDDYIKRPLAEGGEVNLVNEDLSDITSIIKNFVNDLRPGGGRRKLRLMM